jgi:hypothetical protein
MNRRRRMRSYPLPPEAAAKLANILKVRLPPFVPAGSLTRATVQERVTRDRSLARAIAQELARTTTAASRPPPKKNVPKRGPVDDWVDSACPQTDEWRGLTGKTIHRRMEQRAKQHNKRAMQETKGRPVALLVPPSYRSVLRALQKRRRDLIK